MNTLARTSAAAMIAATPILLALGVAGCGGDGLPREGVSGTVSLGGAPLKTGTITFVSDDPNVSTQGGTTIVEGAYDIPRASGLVPGKYKVIISSGEGSKEKPVEDLEALGPGMPPIPAEEVISSQFSENTVLQANVTADGPNKFDFTMNQAGGAP